MTTTISLSEITPAALQRFQKIYASCSDGSCLVWDSGKLLPWTDPILPAPLTEDGIVVVAGLGNNDLEPVRARIIQAGGKRGLSL